MNGRISNWAELFKSSLALTHLLVEGSLSLQDHTSPVCSFFRWKKLKSSHITKAPQIFFRQKPVVFFLFFFLHTINVIFKQCAKTVFLKLTTQCFWDPAIPFKKYGADKLFFNILKPCMTLKIGSRSQLYNHFLYMSQQDICASLVKINPFLPDTGCGLDIFQITKTLCDLLNETKVTQT